MVPYSKPYKTASDLVALLQTRGLKISDTLRAERYISNIGYYRLSAYMFPFLLLPKTNHKFKVGVSFDSEKKKQTIEDLLRYVFACGPLLRNVCDETDTTADVAIVVNRCG